MALAGRIERPRAASTAPCSPIELSQHDLVAAPGDDPGSQPYGDRVFTSELPPHLEHDSNVRALAGDLRFKGGSV